MLTDILIALVVAACFGAGALLYHWASEEIDAFKKRFARFPWLSKAKNGALAPVCLLGILQAVAITTKHVETISLMIMTTVLAFGSFVVAEKDKKLTMKYIAESVIFFMVCFTIIYVTLFALKVI
jgi:hypothetical protein